MATLLLLLFLFAIAGSSDAAWCVCKPDASSTSLQKALDYACGAGADCNPIHQNGPCFNPNTVLAHCSYAANSYYQRNAQNQQACDFAGTAQLSPADPSQPGCTFPATPSAAGTPSTTPSTTPTTPGAPTTPSTTPGAPTTPSTPTSTPTTPGSFDSTPIGGGGGGGTTFDPNAPTGGSSSFGLGPSSNVGFDGSHATTNFYPHPKIICFPLVLALALYIN